MNKKGAIYLIALGSIIVILGVIMYLTEVVGAKGMIIMGFLTELAGVFFYWKNKKRKP
ncbi:hypothetical protein LX97_03223 [Nonlabens dokdonensis]|jgi:hypothetical protein|uniref:Uncharacterized protein n=2 Tax=Nonlabens dokdonensis TaxID=328515 RepID=L7WDX6_NONDD|nr:hypothetical protein [Nonlabens dokdonensis]AGC78141.1 hypothetical protein DDD_3014 [Nonlabens dokdonensis DSW-6]PZX37201.1 hypothetical protein LX97_03223 [Nonlabens dokdonensis]